MSFSPLENHKRLFKNVKPLLHWDGVSPLDKHKEVCRKRLIELLGLDTMERCAPSTKIIKREELGENEHIHFTVQTERDYYVNCHLLLPKKRNGALPLCVCLQGHVSGAHLSLGIEKFPYDGVYISHDVDFAKQAVKRGFAGLAIEQRGFGENGGNPENGATNCAHIALNASLMGRTLIGERVWDVQRVLDAVLDEFSDAVSAEGSILMGESGGGTATYYTACLEDRFELFVPIVALCTFEDSIVSISHCACNYIPSIAKYFDMGDLGVLIAPKRLLIFSTTEDEWFPLNGAKKAFDELKRAYTAHGAENMCQMLIAEGGHRFFADKGWRAILDLLKK